ncbi:MAG TPA: hypothetical protein PKM25_03775, partial [Candidatus Ozemobacteraceae bacterium]|nr:hypothetical protein [Candidatus Ozemobacteraceae bacterium]
MKRIAPLTIWIFCGLMCGQVFASTGTANPLTGGNVTVEDSSAADNDKAPQAQIDALAASQGQTAQAAQAATPSTPAAPQTVNVTVAEGDSLWSLAEK